jgi:tripartite-type tricarboxylate transporter receptor subunit TctC
MRTQMRNIMIDIVFSAALSAITFLPGIAVAQSYPDKPIKLIVPFAVGGPTDLYARLLGAALSVELRGPVVIETRPGAGGLTGVNALARSSPDGYTLCLAGVAALSAMPFMIHKMPFDWERDLALISLVVRVPEVIVMNQTIAADNLTEFVAYARANPSKINFGSAGVGTVTHLGVELLKAEAKIDLVHVPYRGAAPALTDLLGNQIQMQITDVPIVAPYIRSNMLKALAVTSFARSTALPNIPTTREAGFPKVNSDNWYGLVAPAGTSPEVLAILRKATVAALQSPDLKGRFDSQSAVVIPGSPEEFDAHIKSEQAKWAPLVAATGVKLE